MVITQYNDTISLWRRDRTFTAIGSRLSFSGCSDSPNHSTLGSPETEITRHRHEPRTDPNGTYSPHLYLFNPIQLTKSPNTTRIRTPSTKHTPPIRLPTPPSHNQIPPSKPSTHPPFSPSKPQPNIHPPPPTPPPPNPQHTSHPPPSPP